MISTTIFKEEKYAIITIKREPVNSMNLELWQGLWKALKDCEEMMPAVRGTKLNFSYLINTQGLL